MDDSNRRYITKIGFEAEMNKYKEKINYLRFSNVVVLIIDNFQHL